MSDSIGRTDTVTTDPSVMVGTPVFAGTRVPVYTLFSYLGHGSLDEFLEEFQTVTREQALEVLSLAEETLLERVR